LQPDEFLGMPLRRLHVRRPATVDPDAAVVRPSEPLEFLLERGQAGLIFGIVLGSRHQHADPAHPLRLLRARGERPRSRRPAEQRDEFAPFHSITSSARSSNDSGIVTPRALAVVRLTTRSNLVGCSTGMSAGFAPRRILSTKSAARRHWVTQLAP